MAEVLQPFSRLPSDVLQHVLFPHLDLPSLRRVRLVCRRFEKCSRPAFFAKLPMEALLSLGHAFQNERCLRFDLESATRCFAIVAAKEYEDLDSKARLEGATIRTPLFVYHVTQFPSYGCCGQDGRAVQYRTRGWWIVYARYRLATCLQARQLLEEALAVLEPVANVQAGPELTDAIRAARGFCLLELGAAQNDRDKLKAALRSYEECSYRLGLAQYNRACAYCVLGKIEKAKRCLDMAVPQKGLPLRSHALRDTQLAPLHGYISTLHQWPEKEEEESESEDGGGWVSILPDSFFAGLEQKYAVAAAM